MLLGRGYEVYEAVLPFREFRDIYAGCRKRVVDWISFQSARAIRSSWTTSTEHRIRIDRVYEQRLRDMTEEDAEKEGGYTIEEFMELWGQIVGPWDPEEKVIVYEFKLVDPNNT